MNVFELFGKLKLDGSKGVQTELSETERHAQKVSSAMKIMGGFFLAAGAAGLKMVSDARKMNAELGQTAITLGVDTGAMRDLAIETANVTFPLSEVIDTFDLLTQAGLRDLDMIQKVATQFDTLGDATGYTGSEISNILIPTMKTFNLTADEMAGKSDILTYMSTQSTMSMDDFATMVGYTTPELVAQGLTVDELAASLMYMEEQGYAPGRVMTREFMKATTLAKEEEISLSEALGITTEELQGYYDGMAAATGMTDDMAEAGNTQYGVMDKLKNKFDEIALSAGSFLTPLEPIMAAMTAMAPAMILLSSATAMHTISLTAHAIATGISTAAVWLWNAALSANPIGLIILGIVALIAGIVLLVKNWDTVKEKMAVVWEFIGNIVKFQINMIIGYFNGMMWAIEKVINFIGDAIRSIPAITIPDWVPAPFGGKSFKIPAPPAVELPRIPLLDTGGIIEGPGVFGVGPGVKEVVRSPSRGGDIHVHLGNFLGTETELRVFVRKLKEIIGEDDRRSSFGQVNKDFYYGRSAP